MVSILDHDQGEAITDPYAWTKESSTQGVTLDLSQMGEPYRSVMTLVGSNFSDMLIGNDKNNQIVGGSGSDVMKGGEGKDTYTIEATDGSNVINNFALDEQQDFVFFSAIILKLMQKCKKITFALTAAYP